MSAHRSELGGFVTIAQGGPQNIVPPETQKNNAPTTTPKPLIKFFQGEPESLGVTQIVIGITQIVLGIVLTVICHKGRCAVFDIFIYSGVTYWSGTMYIISGSLSVAASYKPTVGKVNSSLVLNIISSVAAAIAMIIFCIFFPHTSMSYYYYLSFDTVLCAYYQPSQDCDGEFRPLPLLLGIVSILFILTVLEFCVALSTSVFGCKTVCRTSYNEVAVVVYHTASANVPGQSAVPTTTALSSDEELRSQ
ncbi:membrane-spanning 4-domains subfamily A member 4A-like isoform X1 [Pseudophryne corroboree]|uniref:membrane-spanning 4-domains subfamily A member 4A-like isoform X1 n=1 Tax=Pseudophryne corroboree TaxID=495146 RepID=UPI00308123D4